MSDNIVIACIVIMLMACASEPPKYGWGHEGGWARVERVCADGSISSRCPLR